MKIGKATGGFDHLDNGNNKDSAPIKFNEIQVKRLPLEIEGERMKEHKNIGIILPNKVNEEPPFAFINMIFSEKSVKWHWELAEMLAKGVVLTIQKAKFSS